MAAAAPVPGAEVHLVLGICGVDNNAVRNVIIDHKGFDTLEKIAMLEKDEDVTEMAKRMAGRNVADGRAILGTVQIKSIQALAWWIRDRIKCGVVPNAAEFDAAALRDAMTNKQVEYQRSETEVSVDKLAKFDPDEYDIHEDAFLNLLAQTNGTANEPLSYVVCSTAPPAVFVNDYQCRMFQLPLNGARFDEDNRTVFRKLKAFLIDTPGWAWIESFNDTENGRDAFLAWSDHYNGKGELSKRTALAKAHLEGLHYKSETSMTFERYCELLTKCFAILHKDEDQRLSNRQKVERLLKGIKSSEAALAGVTAVIEQSYPSDFAGACAYFSSQVSRIHGPAQLEHK